MPEDKKEIHKLSDKLLDAGLRDFSCKVSYQDGVEVCITLRIDDKDVKITR
uniref:Uncharacterized protein n=1 Tax=viral metagenome TaxID=1070528 RepID=A0A6M3LM24_9ZZZZ